MGTGDLSWVAYPNFHDESVSRLYLHCVGGSWDKVDEQQPTSDD
jgi:hypothetical protein